VTLREGWSGRQSPEAKKRGDLKTLLRLPNEPIWITQTHSTIVIEATPENREKNADASFTQEPNCICAVLTADCLPILLCNKEGTQVAAIHAGWRGLANGIVESTLNAFEPSAGLFAWLGPAIGPQKFEVGKDVYDSFTHKHPEAQQAFLAIAENMWLADLYALAKMRLASEGVQHIFGGNFCTYTEENLFFSYRRDKGKTGRMASLIWISPEK
jgi:YfiH family protein